MAQWFGTVPQLILHMSLADFENESIESLFAVSQSLLPQCLIGKSITSSIKKDGEHL